MSFTVLPIEGMGVVQEARKYLGAPYKHLGISRAGIDCIGLDIVVGQALGQIPQDLPIPAYAAGHLFKYMDLFSQYHTIVNKRQVGYGMILAHDASKNIRPRHLAFVSENEYMIWMHWDLSIFKVAEHRITPEIEKNIVGYFRFNGLA